MLKIYLLGLTFAATSAFAAEPKNVDYDASSKNGYFFAPAILCQTLPNGDDFVVAVNLGINPDDYTKSVKRGEGDLRGLAADFYTIYRKSGLQFSDVLSSDILSPKFNGENDDWDPTLDEPEAFEKAEYLLKPKIQRMVQAFAKQKGFSTYSFIVVPKYEKKPQHPCGK